MSARKGGEREGGKRRRAGGRASRGAALAPESAPARPSDDPKDLQREARAQVRAHAAGLRAVSLPLDLEPAFVFRP
jgi:hypothetical protein